MEDIRLPRHVIDRRENRWAIRLQQDARAWSSEKARSFESRYVQTDGARVIPVTVKRARGTRQAQA
jgi:hypothetical protein